MKKSKSALCLVTLAATCAALASCNIPTKADDGTIFTYTTALGTTISYTASDLEKSYQKGGKSASTEFDKVYEVLIRKLYDTKEMETSLKTAKAEADRKVAEQQQTAKNAGGNYKEELEKIFDKYSVKNLDELYDYFLYQEEKKNYESKYNNDYLDAIRDGSTSGLTSNDLFMKSSDTYGIANYGWIREQIPMNIRHILVKVDAAAGEFTQGEISQDNAKKIAQTIMRLAGDPAAYTSSTTRESFGEIAKAVSDDDSSKASFGELSSPATKVMSSGDLVPEFKLGVYAFETLYNEAYKTTSNDDEKKFYDENAKTITPGLKEDATSADDVDGNQVIGVGDNKKTIYDFFKEGEKYDGGEDSGIGQIPYGAAKALLEAAEFEADKNGNAVYQDKAATFYPRNILFNKYFNKHNVCVITPNEIAYNTKSTDESVYELLDGKYNRDYGNLPGFQHNTQNILRKFGNNVLTDKEGNIILAVRAGTSSYQGIHFMVVQRSGLDLNGDLYTPAIEKEEGQASTLSEYYTMVKPGEEGYPTYGANKDKDTYVNYNAGKESAVYTERQGRITNAIKTYNSALSTYIFQSLIENSSIKFTDEAMGKRIRNYSLTKRQSTKDENFETWTNNWKSYAQMLDVQNWYRSGTVDTNVDKDCTVNKHMISEVCAIGYRDPNKFKDPNGDWNKGGKCYYVKQ